MIPVQYFKPLLCWRYGSKQVPDAVRSVTQTRKYFCQWLFLYPINQTLIIEKISGKCSLSIYRFELHRPTYTIAFDLEKQIADELLNNIDWAKVHSALLKKAPAKLFAWLVSGDNTPVNISAYPELAALPSADEQEKAA